MISDQAHYYLQSLSVVSHSSSATQFTHRQKPHICAASVSPSEKPTYYSTQMNNWNRKLGNKESAVKKWKVVTLEVNFEWNGMNGVIEEIADWGYADTVTTWKCYLCSPRNLTKEPHWHKWEKVVEMKRMKRWYQQKLLIKGTLGDNSQHGKHKR